ncbi:MAG: YcfL family protein [Sulfurimonadaceae bacterium]
MKKWIWLVAIALMLGACADKTSYVKVVDDSIEGDISIEKISERINSESGLKELQVLGENETDEYMKLRYRVEWFDKDGFAMESIGTNWTEFPVYKNASFNIHIVAPNKKATDYRLFINK